MLNITIEKTLIYISKYSLFFNYTNYKQHLPNITNPQLKFQSLKPKQITFYSPLSQLNSKTFPTKLHIILNTTLSINNQ